jgi:hypothetical protein
MKLKNYDQVTDNIVDDILNYVGDVETEMYIESYSYSSKAGKLIDIVTFSTMIRLKLLGVPNIHMNFIPPSTLKKISGEYVYPKDSKGMCRDENGKAAGSFDKKDLYIVLLNLDLKFPYVDFLRENLDAMMSVKALPKPFDDISDSVLLTYHGCKLNNINI